MTHICHAHECTVEVPPQLFACKTHWLALPKKIRDAILREYRPGQERDKKPSARYMAVQRLAIAYTAFKPNGAKAAFLTAEYVAEAIGWQSEAVAAGQGDPLEGLLPAAKH